MKDGTDKPKTVRIDVPKREDMPKASAMELSRMLIDMTLAIGTIEPPEMDRLVRMLVEEGIPCKLEKRQLTYYGRVSPGIFRSVVSVLSSRKDPERGLLEATGLKWSLQDKFDGTNGNLHAEEIFDAIKQHWDSGAV